MSVSMMPHLPPARLTYRDYVCPMCGAEHHLPEPVRKFPAHGDACIKTMVAEVKALKSLMRLLFPENEISLISLRKAV